MRMLIALPIAALLASATACNLSERLTGTKPKANAPACTTPPFRIVPDSSYTTIENGGLVTHMSMKFICGEEAKQWDREHPSNRVPG